MNSSTSLYPQAVSQSCASLRLLVFSLVLGFGVLAPVESSAAPDRAVKYMKRVSKDLFAAARTGSTDKMAEALRRHADIKTIGIFSLGTYATRLPKSRRSSYFSGVSRFMARYFMSQHERYKLVSATIESPSMKDEDRIFVDSKVYLESGTTYNVRWELMRRGKSYKIRDVQFLGFSLIALQGNLFRRYIQDHDDNVNALVIALSY